MEKKKTYIDSSLIKNDVLRPWTIDIEERKKLSIETHKLDIVLAYTTPQKFAGVIGGSPLDASPLGFHEFKQTLNQKIIKKMNSNNKIDDINDKNNDIIKSTQSSSRKTTEINEILISNKSSRSNSNTSTPQINELYDASDLAYIDRMQHSIYLKASRTHKHVDPLNSLDTIKYSTSEQALSPYKSKLTLLPVLTNKMKNRTKTKPIIQPGNIKEH